MSEGVIGSKFSSLDGRILQLLGEIKAAIAIQQPLIHCITNPISINDCANILLAIGARPIMAEHPKEVAEITATARALAMNLGNITDARFESIALSAKVAKENNIPSVLDLTGVSCSTIRRNFAAQLIAETCPDVIKGNIAELKAICGKKIFGTGVDASSADMVTEQNADDYIEMLGEFAAEHKTTVMASGPIDLITDSTNSILVANGCKALASITGTGCMLNVLTGAGLAGLKLRQTMANNAKTKVVSKNLAVNSDVDNVGATNVSASVFACMFACLMLELSGEKAGTVFMDKGPGSFHVALLDAAGCMDINDFSALSCVRFVSD